MTEFEFRLHTALRGLQDGKFALEDALMIAKEDPIKASDMIGDVLDESARSGVGRPCSERALSLVELLWSLNEPEDCIRGPFAGRESLQPIVVFLDYHLSRFPDEFSEEVLRLIGNYWKQHLPIVEKCQQLLRVHAASYAAKMRQVPMELSADVTKMKARVSEYEFNPELNSILDKVEEGLGSGDAFDQKSLLTHLRTFFEKLHQQCGEKLRQKKPATIDGTDLAKCGQAIEYLQRKGILTEKMMAFAKALYGVLSDEGAHAIKSEREYVRLCRNMVAEYGLVLFFELERGLTTP